MLSKPSKLSLGISLLVLGGLFIYGQFSSGPEVETATFANEPVSVEGLSYEANEDAIPIKILIPDISLDLDIKKANIVNGYWEVSADSANWGIGSAVPGEVGNQVIFAHAKSGLFLPLKNIKEGMLVYVLTKDSWYRYKVNKIKEVYPNQVDVIAPTTDETLTLYTCTGFKDSKRLIVVSERDK